MPSQSNAEELRSAIVAGISSESPLSPEVRGLHQ